MGATTDPDRTKNRRIRISIIRPASYATAQVRVISIPTRHLQKLIETAPARSTGYQVSTSRSDYQPAGLLLGVLLFLAAPPAFAGPGFIERSKVSGDKNNATIEVRFNCKAQYLRHEPQVAGDRLRVYLDPTAICNGTSPLEAATRTRLRPANSDSAQLMDLEYDGASATGPVLTLTFSKPVEFDIDMSGIAFELAVRVRPVTSDLAVTAKVAEGVHRQVPRPAEIAPEVVINLASFKRVPTIADAPGLRLTASQHLYYAKTTVDGTSWYRLRMGGFESEDDAIETLAILKNRFPEAWIDNAKADGETIELAAVMDAAEPNDLPQNKQESTVSPPSSEVDLIMEDARRSIIAGDSSRAIQLYTKVLQMPENPRQMEAQEYLALAREKQGQLAHAKAEYQRYLALYPDSEGAGRVSQRLAAMLASGRQVVQTAGAPEERRSGRSDWRFQTYFSQYYRRDVNQPGDREEILSQSALYSDVNFDARRRGERFDFSSRISAGYRNDFLEDSESSGNELRISYAYADLSDAVTGLRGRIGRQSRNTGGVLGRFDGLNLGYQVNESIFANAVIGKPSNSATDGVDSSRTFYGASINYGPIFDSLEVGTYFVQQDIEGMTDRQAVGAEFRYFGANQSIWGLVDYDLNYGELGSAFLQASWRFGPKFSLHGSLDRRHSPFLSTGNALIGQPVVEFAQLLELLPADEIKQLGLDRSPVSTTYTIGLSHSLTPRLQINADINQTAVDATPESGGVIATNATTYRYISTNVVASSLVKEGDVTIIGARYSDSDSTRVMSLTIDSRYPFGRAWRINPRLRIDRRQRLANEGYEWLYTPGIRIQYRRSQRFRIELEAGKQFSQQDSTALIADRESYYFNLGYQAFF